MTPSRSILLWCALCAMLIASTIAAQPPANVPANLPANANVPDALPPGTGAPPAPPPASAGSTTTSTGIDWQYLGPFDANGVPIERFSLRDELPPTLLDEIYLRLPERTDIRTHAPELITDDQGANIVLLEDAEISVAFVFEGAGFNNSLGFFTFDPAAIPQTPEQVSPIILFPNFSLPFLQFGDAVHLGTFKAGTAVGFMLAADGWKGSGVNPQQRASMIYYSLKGLNPEPPGPENLNAHNVLLSKPEDELLILGFEDLNRTHRGCDHDFNDALIAIKVTPFSAIDRSQMQSLATTVVDTDGDGVPDDIDAFPLDPRRAARRFYPSATGWGTLAFEDNWPAQGDFDMNDVVLAYRTVEILNAANEIVDIRLFYEVRARGGTARTGFGVHLPGVRPDLLDTANTWLKVNDGDPQPLTAETGQREAVFILAPDLLGLTATGERWPCSFFNTLNRCEPRPAVPLQAEIQFQEPVPSWTLGTPPYNPFIYRSSRGREIHLVDHPPTDRADQRLFNTGDDASVPAEWRYYRTSEGLPWALDIPEAWRYPEEWIDIVAAYPEFLDWAESGGWSEADWFIGTVNEGLLYQP